MAGLSRTVASETDAPNLFASLDKVLTVLGPGATQSENVRRVIKPPSPLARPSRGPAPRPRR
jgi:hypothetical protein